MLTHARGLTVRQPWATPIVRGVKDTENRSERFAKSFRGMLLIHAGADTSRAGWEDPRIIGWGMETGGDTLRVLHQGHRQQLAHGRRRDHPALATAFPRRAVLGVVEVVDIHPDAGCCKPWGEESYEPNNPEDRPPGRVTHLVLERPTEFAEPIPLQRGALNLWRPDPDLMLEVAHRLAELVTWDLEGARQIAERGGDYDADYLWAALDEAS